MKILVNCYFDDILLYQLIELIFIRICLTFYVPLLSHTKVNMFVTTTMQFLGNACKSIKTI